MQEVCFISSTYLGHVIEEMAVYVCNTLGKAQGSKQLPYQLIRRWVVVFTLHTGNPTLPWKVLMIRWYGHNYIAAWWNASEMLLVEKGWSCVQMVPVFPLWRDWKSTHKVRMLHRLCWPKSFFFCFNLRGAHTCPYQIELEANGSLIFFHLSRRFGLFE